MAKKAPREFLEAALIGFEIERQEIEERTAEMREKSRKVPRKVVLDKRYTCVSPG